MLVILKPPMDTVSRWVLYSFICRMFLISHGMARTELGKTQKWTILGDRPYTCILFPYRQWNHVDVAMLKYHYKGIIHDLISSCNDHALKDIKECYVFFSIQSMQYSRCHAYWFSVHIRCTQIASQQTQGFVETKSAIWYHVPASTTKLNLYASRLS